MDRHGTNLSAFADGLRSHVIRSLTPFRGLDNTVQASRTECSDQQRREGRIVLHLSEETRRRIRLTT